MKLNRSLFKNDFVKNVVTLMTGTTIAQAIPIAISPILTRLYTPEDFGVLSVFVAITAITGAIANAKYEQAIVLPREDKEAINILVLGIVISIFISLFLLLIVLLFNTQIVIWLGNDEIRNWLYFIPLSTLLLGIFNCLNFYNIRKKKFKNISYSQITKTSSSALTQVSVGLLQTGPLGLVLGQIVSYFSGNLVLYKALKEKGNIKEDISKSEMIALSKTYKKFPIYSMPSIFINSLNLNSISFLIPSIFSITTLGFYSLTQRIIGIPARVIGKSFSQVYFQKATEEFNNKGNTLKAFKSTLKKLVLIALPMFLTLYFIAEPIFAFVFGEEWRIAGTYAKILVPLAFVRFVSSSLSITTSIHLKQQFGLLINIVLLSTTILVFMIAKYYAINFEKTLQYFVVLLSLEYASFLWLYWKIAANKI